MKKLKKTSSVSANMMIAALKAMGYVNAPLDEDDEHLPRPTTRKAYKKTPDSKLSISGKSIHLIFAGTSERYDHPAREVFVPAKGMLGHGTLATLKELTGVEF